MKISDVSANGVLGSTTVHEMTITDDELTFVVFEKISASTPDKQARLQPVKVLLG